MSRVLTPTTLAELWQALADAPGAAIMAGGTDLMPRRRCQTPPYPPVICLERLPELSDIRLDGDCLRLGACVSHTRLAAHPLVARHARILALAANEVGSPPIRNMGTLGGNLCTASPAGDTLPPLHALEALVEISSQAGRRTLPLPDFIRGPGRTDLRPGEIVSAALVPIAPQFDVEHFEKVGKRRALAIAVVSLAALLRLGPDGRVADARLALGSVGPAVIRARKAEASLIGQPLNRDTLTQAAALIRGEVNPIDDQRATAAYRRQVAGNLLLRLA